MKAQNAVPQGTGRKAGRTRGVVSPKEIHQPRRLPIGAEVVAGGGTHFRVWAPKHRKMMLQLCDRLDFPARALREVEMESEAGGYFSGFVAEAHPGVFYKFKPGAGSFSDPASRFQPNGPHGPSEVVDPFQFRWRDGEWRGVERPGQVIYELHIGTFTPEGTWAAAAEQLSELARLGVTVIELMPVADFPGQFGWGYDGVSLFAPTRLYGRPDDLRAFIDQAHRAGLGVILDVVYNHLGPDGNYLKQFSEDYFTDRYRNEWGQAINFDGPQSGPVREFFTANAAYWIEEFHLDGLRLDATQQIFDASPNHILSLISRRVREAAQGKAVYLAAENESQETRLARPFEAGGYGLDALWNDDFHHTARVALTGHNEAYYGDYKGSPQELISAVKRGFLYQGQWFCWQKKRRGSPTFGLAPEQFINYLQNHDQVANSLRGLRMHQIGGANRCKALTALLLLGPGTPLLFQGQEFWASAPFLFFADHNPELARLVRQGRHEFLRQFSSIASSESEVHLADPSSVKTFESCKLDFSERERHRHIYKMHHDLLKLRREDEVFKEPRAGAVDGAVLGADAMVLRFFGKSGQDRLLLVNLGVDLQLSPAPEPLLAPVAGSAWTLKWSSDAPCYGGRGITPLEKEGIWMVPGHATVVLEPAQV